MRIAIDIRPMLEARRSGVAIYTARLLEALLARPTPAGRHYALFCNAHGRPQPADLPPPSAAVEHHLHRYPNRLLNAAFAFLGTPKIETLTGGADLAYLPNLNFVASAKPLVVTVHDLSFERYPEFFSAKQRLWHALIRPRRLLGRAAAVVAVSEHTKTDLVETYGLKPEKIRVISPGVGEEFRPQDAAAVERLRGKYGLGDEPLFLYLGTLEPRKNVESVIAAFEKLPGRPRLVIAGGRGWLYRRIFRQAAASPAKDRIIFLDYVGEDEKPALYAAATALVYPSFYEGFGMPPLEAMATGTPVIASHASSLGEVVGEAGLLVDPDDIAEIADAMQAMLDEPELRKKCSESGLLRSRSFTWAESAARLDRLFADLEGARTPARGHASRRSGGGAG